MKMEMTNQNQQLNQDKKNFLLEIAYLTEQMDHAHMPLKEGYQKLKELIKKSLKAEKEFKYYKPIADGKDGI